MAWSMKIEGMDEISEMLNKCDKAAPGIAAAALYEGAAVVADAIKESVKSIRTEPFRYVKNGDAPRLPSPQEKGALSRGYRAGIAKFRKSGDEVQTSVGTGEGYIDLTGHEMPVSKLARAIESGTSFRVKQPFMRKAANAARGKASERILAEIDKRFETIMKDT